jgi:hypothetical protein
VLGPIGMNGNVVSLNENEKFFFLIFANNLRAGLIVNNGNGNVVRLNEIGKVFLIFSNNLRAWAV